MNFLNIFIRLSCLFLYTLIIIRGEDKFEFSLQGQMHREDKIINVSIKGKLPKYSKLALMVEKIVASQITSLNTSNLQFSISTKVNASEQSCRLSPKANQTRASRSSIILPSQSCRTHVLSRGYRISFCGCRLLTAFF